MSEDLQQPKGSTDEPASQSLQQQNDRLQLLLNLTSRITSNLELREVLRAVAGNIRELMQCDAVAFLLYDELLGKFKVLGLDFPQGKGFVREEQLVASDENDPGTRAFQTLTPVVVSYRDQEVSREMYEMAMAEGVKTSCFIPLVNRGRALGVLGISRTTDGSFSPDDIGFLSQASGQIAIAVENALAYTEISALKDRLAQEKLYLAEAQSLTHIGSWATNFDTGQIFHLSDEVFRLHGFDPKQGPIPLERFYETLHPEDKPAVMATLENAIRTRTDYDIREFRIRLSDGTIRFLRTIGHHNRSGEIGEYLGITMDITERKRAEEERERLRQLEADLAHINRVNMMGELAAALAHEIKQPIAASITSANSCLRWLAHDPPNLERARAAATRSEKEGNRAADVVNRLRSFYKKGKAPEPEMVDVRTIIREMTALVKNEAVRHSITIRPELDRDVPCVLGDRVQLQQVFMNLMLNAIEAMQDTGGELTITSRLNPEGQLLISVSDTGVGLPVENTERIFDAFHTTKPQGTGMGLAITRSILESHGGRVWATANQGAGATFHFTLPSEAGANK
jgi:PAS domain S-box-containing protein